MKETVNKIIQIAKNKNTNIDKRKKAINDIVYIIKESITYNSKLYIDLILKLLSIILYISQNKNDKLNKYAYEKYNRISS